MNLQAFAPGSFGNATLSSGKNCPIGQVPKGESVIVNFALREQLIRDGLDIDYATEEPFEQIEGVNARIEQDTLRFAAAHPTCLVLDALDFTARDVRAHQANLTQCTRLQDALRLLVRGHKMSILRDGEAHILAFCRLN